VPPLGGGMERIMQKIKCELCGSNNFVKQDGYFVCQDCKTKYTVKEARKMISEDLVEAAGNDIAADTTTAIAADTTTDTKPPLSIQTRITVYSGEITRRGCFTAEIAALLRAIEDIGSIYAGIKTINICYSHAWRILKETEANLGFSLIDRAGVRGSTLTKEGKKLLETYETIQAEVEELATNRFEQLTKI
jgi:molybdate transport system regulatory protein